MTTHARRRGSVATLVAVMIPALLTLTGFGIDLSRLWLVQARLQTALDAAALIAARELQLTSRDADATAMFWSNFALDRAAGGTGYFGAVASSPAITQVDQTTVMIAAQAKVRLVFGALLGHASVSVSDQAQSVGATAGMELALVLDNTGSMAGAPMQAMRESATQLINIVYGAGAQDSVPNLWVSVVPFTAEVNIGPSHTGWLAPGSYSPASYANTRWMGCVLARHAGGHDTDDAPPKEAPFTPFLYPSTLNPLSSRLGHLIPGDNDWSANNITEASQDSLPDNTAVGPNLGCDASAILPQTASRGAVLSVIGGLAQTYRGGTFINLGLQAGWFTLSPRWQGIWGNSALPLAYNTPNMRKVIVLLTDGNNEWYSWPGGAPDNLGDADATAYGRLSANLLGLTAPLVTASLNTSMSAMCTTIKNNGITIYTVLFNHGAVNAATIALFQSCASSPQTYFLAPTPADLATAFSAIGSQLVSLRLSR